MAAGSRVGMLALYGIVNTVSLLLYLLVDRVYVPLLYGMVVTSTTFELLCPAFHILSIAFLHPTQIETGAVYLNENGALVQETINVFTVEGADWGYIGVLALIGLVLTGAALWLYRRRDLERAGDFLAFPRLTALFQVVFSLICATGCYAFYSLFLGTTKSAYPLPLFQKRVSYSASGAVKGASYFSNSAATVPSASSSLSAALTFSTNASLPFAKANA